MRMRDNTPVYATEVSELPLSPANPSTPSVQDVNNQWVFHWINPGDNCQGNLYHLASKEPMDCLIEYYQQGNI